MELPRNYPLFEDGVIVVWKLQEETDFFCPHKSGLSKIVQEETDHICRNDAFMNISRSRIEFRICGELTFK